MQKTFILSALLTLNLIVQAQVGIGTKTPHASAMLEVTATNKGILIPRMTLAQRNAIKSPANSLMIYQTDNTPGYYYYASNSWTRIANGNSSGGVTNTFTAPLTLTGTTVSIPQANASNNGFLSAADWNKFNKVENGTNTGDMLYWNGSSWVKLAAPEAEASLVFCDGLPTWGGCLSSLSTSSVTDITASTATAGGTLIKTGGTAILDKGIVWSTTANPTISLNTKKSFGSGSESFTGTITGLEPSTVYYARAYATNSKGTSYGNEISFTTTAVDLTTGLVAYYPFNGNANDESGNGNHGTVDRAILTSDRFNNLEKAFYFNGVNSTIYDINPVIPQNNTFTISLWVKPSTVSGIQEFLHQNWSPDPFYIGNYNGILRCGDSFQETGVFISNNEWQNFIVVRNFTNSVSVYKNGVLVSSINTDIVIGGLQSDKLVFGKQYGNYGEYFDGSIDDIRIYNRALTPSEITYLATH